MTREYLKKATLTRQVRRVRRARDGADILDDIEAGGDAKAMEYAAKFDSTKAMSC